MGFGHVLPFLLPLYCPPPPDGFLCICPSELVLKGGKVPCPTPRRHLPLSGHTVVVTTWCGRGGAWHLANRGQGASEAPPPTKNYPDQNVSTVAVEKLLSDIVSRRTE